MIKAGLALMGTMASLHGAHAAAAPTCPVGTPVQAITVVNQANAQPWALAKVENAVTDQSLQLRAAWGTPCVQFAAGGWPVYLQVGGTEWGVHYTQPTRAFVYTAGLPYTAWSTVFSHEVVEMMVDPTTTNTYTANDANGGPIEIADPVDQRAYRLDGVWVQDFVTPAYFAGANYGVCATVLVGGQPTTQCDGPPVAPAATTGPYDEMGVLTAPWQTTWERPSNRRRAPVPTVAGS
jgi:hypothetical protein